MYQSLYRKYRPKNFDEVVGQEVVVKTLKNAIINNHLNHAYLFTGPRGTGKTSIAKIFAKTVNCSNLKETNPCEECVNCTQIKNKQSVDIIEIDAASNNGVDEIRELRNKASLVPTTGSFKVYIIDEVHMLTTGAFNALLKTLEEPPTHVIFILATTEPHKIPATILSRCQRFDFKKIPKRKMIDRLKLIAQEEKIEAEENVYEEVAHLSDGCMRDALSIFDQVIAYSNNKIKLDDVHEVNGTLPSLVLIQFLMNILDRNYKETFSLIDEYDNKGKNFVKLSEEFLLLLRNIMLYITIPNYEFEDELKMEYQKITEKVDFTQLLQCVKLINETIVDMKKSNNPKILFEMFVVSMLNKNTCEFTISLQNDVQKIEAQANIEKKSNETTKQLKIEDVKPVTVGKVVNMEEPAENEIKVLKPEKRIDKDYNKNLLEKIENVRKIRVNNTLCNFNKKILIEMKNRIDEVRNFLIDPDYTDIASIIIDGDLKAASNENLIFLYKTKRMELEFNVNIPLIDELLEKVFHQPYKAVATNESDWNKIKEEFNSKIKTYVYMEEPKNIKEYLGNDEKDESLIDNLFGEIVEYS